MFLLSSLDVYLSACYELQHSSFSPNACANKLRNFAERMSASSGSSFYNKNLKHQK